VKPDLNEEAGPPRLAFALAKGGKGFYSVAGHGRHIARCAKFFGDLLLVLRGDFGMYPIHSELLANCVCVALVVARERLQPGAPVGEVP
jgi:hypothetical protein